MLRIGSTRFFFSIFFMATCLALFAKGEASQHPSPYPAKWWATVDPTGAPSWEILPQSAGKGEVILSKRTELGILSNFAATPFELHGKRYESLEGFWQMMKYPESKEDPRATFPGLIWAYTREQVSQMTAFEAKKAGDLGSDNMKKMGIGWVTYQGKHLTYRTPEKGDHYNLIVEATWAKIRQNPKVREILLATGDLILKPDHHQEANTPPAWKYFDIYMMAREELKKGR